MSIVSFMVKIGLTYAAWVIYGENWLTYAAWVIYGENWLTYMSLGSLMARIG